MMIFPKRILFLLLFVLSTAVCSAQVIGFWEPASGTNGWSAVRTMVVNGNSVIAFTQETGVFRSDDNLDTWQRISDGPVGVVRVMLGDNTALYAATSRGMARSTNNGVTWEPYGLEDYDVLSFAMSGNVMFAGTGEGDVWRSVDAGKTWNRTFNGGQSSAAYIGSVVFNGAFAMMTRGTMGPWRSLDSGKTWQAFSPVDRADYITDLILRDTVLWASTSKGWVITSNDSGRIWKQRPAQVHPDGIVDLMVTDRGLFVSTYYGAHVSLDSGATWITPAVGEYQALTAFTPYGNDVLMAVDGGKIIRTDLATHHEWVNIGLDGDNGPDHIAVRDGVLYAASWALGMLRSTNNGNSWKIVESFPPGFELGHSFIATRNSFFMTSSDGKRLFRTQDYGKSWEQIDTIPAAVAMRIVSVGDVIIVAQENYIYRSTNEGDTWERIQYGDAMARSTALAMRGSMVLVGTQLHGTYRSTDNGSTWTRVREHVAEGAVDALAVNDRGIFAGMYRGELYRSTDNGATWQWLNNGWVPGLVDLFAVTPTAVFAHSRTLGLMLGYSDDNGDSWASIEGGDGGDVRSLATDSLSIFAANGTTVVRRSIVTLAAPEEREDDAGGAVALRVTPNPVRSQAVARFTTQSRTPYSLVLVDALGRECMNLGSGIAEAGELRVPLNLESLAAGTYYLHFRTTTGLHTASVALVK